MKKLVVFFVLLLALVQVATAEVDLEIVWKRYMYETQTYINFAKFSADGNYVYCAVNGNIQVLDASNGKFTKVFKQNPELPAVTSIAQMDYSPNSNLIMTINDSGRVHIWDPNLEMPIKSFLLGVNTAVFTADGYKVLIVSSRAGIRGLNLHDLTTDKDTFLLAMDYLPHKLAMSHNGKTFAAGLVRKDYDDIYYDCLTLYDAETFKEISILEDIEGDGDGYRILNFSDNDKFLAKINKVKNKGHIYDLNTYQKIISTDISKLCFNIKILPDNYHYLTFFADWSGNIELVLNNFTKTIKNYQFADDIIETYGTADNWKIFYGGANDTFYVFKNSETDVKANEENTKSLTVNYSSDILKILFNEIPSTYFEMTIYDLTGKIIYAKKIENISSDGTYNINLALPTGIYICNIKNENKEYSQKFEVVR